jgi:Protein of unknown function (DUF4089)
MNDPGDDVGAVVDAMARLLDLALTADSRPVVLAHFDIAAKMAAGLMEFPLLDDAEPAPVFTP